MASFAEIYETLPGNGWLTKAEAELLWEWVQKVGGPILEVGCHQGRSTVLLAATKRTVYAVDPFDGFSEGVSGDQIEDLFQRNMLDREITNVRLFRQKIEDWTVRQVGVAYLDGDHTYEGTLAQIHKATLAKAKIILIHDVNDTGGGLEVKNACLLKLGPYQQRVQRLAVWDLRDTNKVA